MAITLRKALPAALKEIRLHGCQTSPSSAGVRAFIQTSYTPIKNANPNLKLLIREAAGTSPRVWARFDMGVEKQASLEGANDAAEVERRIIALLK